MSSAQYSHGLRPVSNPRVWGHLKVLFLGALAIFLVNIALGFLNAVSTGGLERWQVLTHLHAGTIGWITLSAIGVAIWLFTGGRDVSATYVARVRQLVWAGVLVFAGYVASFGIGFYAAGDAMALVPVFGTAAMLVIWAATAFVLAQVGDQPVLTTAHVMIAAALLVASLGALFGVLAGITNAFGSLAGLELSSIVSMHRAPMEIYVLLFAAAMIEWIVGREGAASWTWPGMGIALAWVAMAIVFVVGGGLGIQPLIILGFLLSFVVIPLLVIVRVGWKALLEPPTRPGVASWGFFGTLGLLTFAVVFIVVLLVLGGPEWSAVVVFHIFFIGMVTNLIFGVLSAGTADARRLHALAEPTAMWVMNVGLVVFLAARVAAEVRHGAILMGLGVLLGVAAMLYRLSE